MYPTLTRRAIAGLFLFLAAACDRPDAVGVAPDVAEVDAARRGLALDIARGDGRRLAVGDTTTIEVSSAIRRARIVRWLSSDDRIATVSARGLVTGVRSGTARITVLSSGGTQVTTVAVVDADDAAAAVARVEVMAPASTVPVGGQMALTAIARDVSGAVVSGRTTRWSRAAGTAATINANGLLTAVSTGPVTVRATVDGVSDDRTFAVTSPVQDGPPPTITSLEITPGEDVRLVPRGVEQFDAAATWSNGDVTEPQVSWRTTRGTITSTGQYTAPSTTGTFLVIAQLAGDTLADTVSVLVAEEVPTVTAFSISPASGPALAPGATRQFTRNVSWSDGRSRSVGVTFSATGGTITSNGLFRAGQAAGVFMVIANCACGRADTAEVVISQAAAQLASLTISPSTVAMQAGSQRQFSASAVWSTGSTTMPPITYSATGGTIAQTGLYTAPSTAGTYRVIVAHTGGQLRDTAVVTVTSPVTLTSLSISPSSVTLNPGGTRQFAVSATWSDGGSSVPPVTYSATGGSVTAGGLYTAPGAAGTYRVIAAHTDGTRRDTAVVTVQAAAVTLTALAINPATVSMPVGATQQFAVSATWSNGGTTPPSVTYSATGGSVTASGVFTAPATTGTYRVIAAHVGGTLRDTSVVTVTAPTGGGGGTTPPPSGSAACPNEPAGYSRYGDITFSSINPLSGWSILGADRSLLTDLTAPFLGTSIAFKHEAGATDGQIGILQTTDFDDAPGKVYSCVVFKQSANYVQHGAGTKFIYTPQNGSSTRPIQFQMYPTDRNSGPGGHFRWRMEMQSGDSQRLYEDNQSASNMTPGTWYRLEFLTMMNTPGSKNGTLMWWTSAWNGSSWSAPVLNARHTNVLIAGSGMPATWRKWEYNLYYGGQGSGPIPADQFIVMNRVYVSTAR